MGGGGSTGIIFRGEGNFLGWSFQGKFCSGGFAIIPKRNPFYLSYFLFANPILHLEMFRGLFSACLDFREKMSTEEGISGVTEKTIKNLILSKWNYINENISDWIVHKTFYGEGDFQQGWNCLEGILRVGGCILRGSKFWRSSFPWGRELLMEGDSDLPVLFEKRFEIK